MYKHHEYIILMKLIKKVEKHEKKTHIVDKINNL